MTGTPKGVGAINTGDNFEAKLIVDKSLTDIKASETLLSCEWVAK
jgi:2-keto-4-pentenoate hydratase/2-oxohepta-3-ene-1,7-dioic acid hydratase in catechol pathway